MDKTDLLELARRCEEATGPDRELDVAIGLTGKFYIAEPRWPGAEPMIGYADADGTRVEPGNGAQDTLVPRYTASLDAAMTLVPEHALWTARTLWDGDKTGGYAIVSRYEVNDDEEVGYRRFWIDESAGNAATPALALCAAALKARASLFLFWGGVSDGLERGKGRTTRVGASPVWQRARKAVPQSQGHDLCDAGMSARGSLRLHAHPNPKDQPQ